jgi:hypothetical protein
MVAEVETIGTQERPRGRGRGRGKTEDERYVAADERERSDFILTLGLEISEFWI